MLKTIFSALLLCCLAQAQLAPAAPAAGSKSNELVPATSFSPTTPVITLAGFCPEAPAGTAKASPECKTVVTKAEFEKLIDTLNPKMPAQARQSVAGDYAKMLVLSDDAKKRGLEDTQRFKELLSFVRMQVAAQELIRNLQEESKPTDAEVQKYYQDNSSKYEEISLKRIFIPRNTPNAKPTDPKPTDESLKAEGEKIRARLAAGEDFDKVEKEIYVDKGYKTPAPPTGVPNWRRDAVPPAQASLFDLKQGELSPVMVEPAGAYIYKLEEKKVTPLETMKTEIVSQMTNQKMHASMDALTSSIKPELNEVYFRSLNAGAPGPGMIGPAGSPSSRMSMGPRSTAQQTAPSPASQGSTPQK